MAWLVETLIDDELNVTYEFKAGFDYSREFNELKRNHQEDYAIVCSGEPCVSIYSAVLGCSLSSVNGEKVQEHEREDIVKTIIDRFGAQACSYVCHKIMFQSYIGEIESKKSMSREKWQDILNNTSLSQSGIFSRAGLLWVTISILSGAAGCLILNGLQGLG